MQSIGLLLKYINNNNLIAGLVSKSCDTRVPEINKINKEIRKIKPKKKQHHKEMSVFEKYSLSSLGKEVVENRYKQFDIKSKNLELRLEGTQERKNDLLSKHDINTIQARLKKFKKCFSKSKGSQKRELIEMLIKR